MFTLPFGLMDGTSVGSTLAFHALAPDDTTYEMLGVKEGTGDLTTTHADTLYAPDHEGVYRAFGADEPVWAGGRVATNLVRTKDLSNATLWQRYSSGLATDPVVTPGFTDPDGGSNAYRVQLDCVGTAGGDQCQLRDQSTAQGATSTTAITSAWIKSNTGTTQYVLFTGNIEITVTTEWQRLSDSVTASFLQAVFYLIGDRSTDTTADILVYKPQFERPDGRTDTVTPSEYVETNSTAATKVFANLNGNTVTNNVVTEAVGAPLPEMPYLQYYPAATNAHHNSRNVTNWAVNNYTTAVADQVGIDGTPNTSWRLLNSGNFQNAGDSVTGLTANVPTTLVVYIKKTDTYTHSCSIRVTKTVQTDVILNLNSGGLVERDTTTGIADAYESVDVGDYWKVLIQVTGAELTCNPRFYSCVNTNDSNQFIGGIGEMIIGNVEVYDNKTIPECRGLGPIFTTSAAVSVAVTNYSFDLANMNLNEASLYLEGTNAVGSNNPENISMSSSYVATDWTHYQMQATSGGSGGDFGEVRMRNASGIVPRLQNQTIPRDSELKLGITWSVTSGNAEINYAGTTLEGAFTGFNSAQNKMQLFSVAAFDAYESKIRNIQCYDITSYQEGKDTIDGLMA